VRRAKRQFRGQNFRSQFDNIDLRSSYCNFFAQMSRLTRTELANHYRFLRAQARDIVAGVLAAEGRSDIRLSDITPAALQQAATWAAWADRQVGWDWAELYEQRSRRPRHISLAIWIDPTLCALLLGRVTDGRVIARVDRIERSPGVTKDQIASVIVVGQRYLDTLGRLAGCREAVVWEPFPWLIERYKDVGFKTEIVVKGKIVGLKYDLV